MTSPRVIGELAGLVDQMIETLEGDLENIVP